ncbi:biotin--[acetyl-CoA-carboxylase] ligase [Gillisia sp. M10.2A]|uniref:Biotin--[acetyl-CoA-carboxylase] ligase n=1 Tax=Gillisia lutea TaxID=2909668 RepID=A0ABS9EJB6_9FLAO|nr:biotin--[acetyl-CoA-carboxylase] ligase [Gillisia lutea]MCF4102442.1 biotin--[acetyl-CoA-carboxylase] ligase [Gillisia lutea]
MRIIKVSATQSTNSFAREWYQSNRSSLPVCIIAANQTSGRGQRGATWVSKAGENLTFSVVYPNPELAIQDQFLLSASVGLAILDAMKELNIYNLNLKWPNDILAANFKIGGILIENILNSGKIDSCIIGIGLNVNQLSFPGLPKASSLKSLNGRQFELEEVLSVLLQKLNDRLDSLPVTLAEEVLKEYEDVLFRKGKVSTFQLKDSSMLTGIIVGITSTGLLKVQVEDNKILQFDLKELKLLF